MTERKNYKAKHSTEDQKSMISAMALSFGSFFGQQIAKRKHKLIEINPHPDHEAVTHHYLSPANLRHVTVFDDQVILYCGYDDQIRITITEWERIQSFFGYSDPSKPSIENLINAQCPEETDTE